MTSLHGFNARGAASPQSSNKVAPVIQQEQQEPVSLRDVEAVSSDCNAGTTSLNFLFQGKAASCKGRISPLGGRIFVTSTVWAHKPARIY
jgi:hypothetical protein